MLRAQSVADSHGHIHTYDDNTSSWMGIPKWRSVDVSGASEVQQVLSGYPGTKTWSQHGASDK